MGHNLSARGADNQTACAFRAFSSRPTCKSLLRFRKFRDLSRGRQPDPDGRIRRAAADLGGGRRASKPAAGTRQAIWKLDPLRFSNISFVDAERRTNCATVRSRNGRPRAAESVAFG